MLSVTFTPGWARGPEVSAHGVYTFAGHAGTPQSAGGVNWGISAYAAERTANAQRSARQAVDEFAKKVQAALRADTLAGGLGTGVANAWRIIAYGGAMSNHPAALVYSKAPKIIAAFGEGVTIASAKGLWLAIPTDNCPRRGNRRMIPAEVEASWNQDLVFIPGARPDVELAGIDEKLKSAIGAWRAGGSRGAAPVAHHANLAIMFVMLRQVHLRKRLDWPALFERFTAEWQGD